MLIIKKLPLDLNTVLAFHMCEDELIGVILSSLHLLGIRLHIIVGNISIRHCFKGL